MWPPDTTPPFITTFYDAPDELCGPPSPGSGIPSGKVGTFTTTTPQQVTFLWKHSLSANQNGVLIALFDGCGDPGNVYEASPLLATELRSVTTRAVLPGTYEVVHCRGDATTYWFPVKYVIEDPPPPVTNVDCATATDITTTGIDGPRYVDDTVHYYQVTMGQAATRRFDITSSELTGEIWGEVRTSCGGAPISTMHVDFGQGGTGGVLSTLVSLPQGTSYLRMWAKPGSKFTMPAPY